MYLNPLKPTPMLIKNVPVILCLFLFPAVLLAQQVRTDYDARWKVVDSLVIKKELVASALKEASSIYLLAKNEGNDIQSIKALLYRMGLSDIKEIEALPKNITLLEKEIVTAKQPARSILQNILALQYTAYFESIRWKLYDRTPTAANFHQEDPATWSEGDFRKRITDLYLASIQEKELLSNTNLSELSPIINRGNSRSLRPTLYDLLAHNVLDYFKKDGLGVPVDAFEIDDTVAFAPAAAFTSQAFQTIDSSSLNWQVLRLFQELIRLHLKDVRHDALLDVDLERLQFVRERAVMEDKIALYGRALGHLSTQYRGDPAGTQAWYLLARYYADLAGDYAPNVDSTNRYDLVQAKAICDELVNREDSSEGQCNCRLLLKQILQPEISLETEKINIPGQPFRALLTWKNLSTAWIRIVNIDSSKRKLLKGGESMSDKLMEIRNWPPYREVSQILPETSDHQPHRVEIRIDALPPGEYAVWVSGDKEFNPNKSSVALQYLYVSSIAFINHGRDYFVLDRGTGKPMAGANIEASLNFYDYRKGKYVTTYKGVYRVDKHGHFRLAQSGNLDMRISVPGDTLRSNDGLVRIESYQPQESEKETLDSAKYETDNLMTFFFTDRSLYRPGQTVEFKGVVSTKDKVTHRAKILSHFQTKVVLLDANETKLDSVFMVTNEFGSYYGSFKLPEQLVNGEFTIMDDSTNQSIGFSVEEYKRPRFYATFETPKGGYRINDSVKVTGSAKGYAGNNIEGALVKYHVTREYRQPYLGGIERRNTSKQEIMHGSTRTKQDGSFVICFVALPDRSVNMHDDPVFTYQLSADITDPAGETRSTSTSIAAGYKAMEISIDMPTADHLPNDHFSKLVVKTTNLAGELQPAKVHTVIYKIKPPDRLIRKRLWTRPDQFVMSREEYLAAFPHDEYNNETNMAYWERDEKVFDTIAAGGEVQNIGKILPAGKYVIEASSRDMYGLQVEATSFVVLYDSRTGEPGSPEYCWDLDGPPASEPGSPVDVSIGSSAADLFVIRYLDKKTTDRTSEAEYSFLQVDRSLNTVAIPTTEIDRGGFSVSDVFIKDNRIYTRRTLVRLPWSNKDLKIHYASYRDKMLPGSKENWTLTVSGFREPKVIAEIVTAMYDASLDQFVNHSWDKPAIWDVHMPDQGWNTNSCFTSEGSEDLSVQNTNYRYDPDCAKWYDQLFGGVMIIRNADGSIRALYPYSNPEDLFGRPMAISVPDLATDPDGSKGLMRDTVIDVVGGISAFSGAPRHMKLPADARVTEMKGTLELIVPDEKPLEHTPSVNIRKNFAEMAFFLPDLHTDSAGNVSFSFTMPEALTTWKWMTLAHTKDLAFGYAEKSVITQKPLMVQPNAPRFLREGDRMELTTKIVNLTDSEMTGQAELQLTDPTTGQSADGWFTNRQANQYFTVGARQSVWISWPIEIPFQYSRPLTYRITAGAGLYSDGEEAILPVVSNRMLVTESLPLNLKPGAGGSPAPHGAVREQHFVFDKLLQSGNSETLSQHALTVEFTSNPAWYAVQALPYLMEYPYECAEQTFNRFYADALAAYIVNSSPRIRAVFEKWKTADTAALLSNLEKNQELKSVLLEETPWVFEARSESQQKKNIALLFDMVRMQRELGAALDKLNDLQSSNGAFPWFKGGLDDRYITQYIVTGIGRLMKLKTLPEELAKKATQIADAAMHYADNQIKKDYDELKKQLKRGPVAPSPESEVIQYLYMRSYFPANGIPGDVFPAVNTYRKRVQQSWLKADRQLQGMIALALYRTGDIRTAKEIMASLKEYAIRDKEQGMYWKQTGNAFYWDGAPIETQSLLIEAFREISSDGVTDAALKTWLLRQKQTRNWSTTKATADACYALLLGGTDWLSTEREVTIRLGDKTVSSTESDAEAGTGYFKKVFDGSFVQPSMGNITVTMKGGPADASTAWGAVYWQYFENLDKIVPPDGQPAPLRLSKKLFIEKNTDKGPVLEPIEANGALKPGDKVVVRIELRSDRDLEYVHMKDMRAACMEPVNVLSGYKWQGGLGYYESTKDASTDFFFDRVPVGTYVFEYPLFVGQTGNFSNGVTSIECMYAPEFAFHSEGIRVNVERP
jgi:hypothetical protein